MAAGSLVGGIGAYLFQVVGTRALGEEAYAPISVLWTIQYLILAIPLVSIEAYVTRTVTRNPAGPHLDRRSSRALLAWVAGIAAVVGAGTWLATEQLFHGLDDLALVAALVVAAYGLLFILRGEFAGADRFRAYGFATAGESTIRLVTAAVVLALASTPRALAWVLPVGPAAVVVLWLLGGGRRHVPDRSVAVGAEQPAGPSSATGAFLASTTTANAAAQILLAGGPLGLVALGAPPAEISVFFVTITAARIPMVFAINGVLSRLLPPLTRLAERGDASGLLKLTGLTAVATSLGALVAAGAAALVGRELVAVFFGAAFAPDRMVVTLIGAAVMLGTGTLFLNQVLIGCHAEHRLPAPWLLALAAGVGVMLAAEGSPGLRVATGFLAGEVVALLGLLVVAVWTLRDLARAAGTTRPPLGRHHRRSFRAR